MLCSHCNKREANFHYKQVTNGKYTELHLCGECATELGYLNVSEHGFGIEDMLGEFLGFANHISTTPPVCKNCGTTYEELKKRGLVGCSECYSIFEKEIESMLSRIQPATVHKGKIAGERGQQISRKNELKQLKEEIARAITEERYEDAAKLRDRIKEAESRGESNG